MGDAPLAGSQRGRAQARLRLVAGGLDADRRDPSGAAGRGAWAGRGPDRLWSLLSDGGERRHVEAVRARPAKARGETRERLLAASLTVWNEPRGGIFLWARLPGPLSAVEVSRAAMRLGVVLAPGDVFSVGQRAGDYLRFNVAQSPLKVFEVLERAMRG